jgi:uncharacterized protein (TIGR02996 family)
MPAKTPAMAFLQAIHDNADDDTDRLVYADWLDDQGDADRAAFIRAQCALERLDPSDPEWVEHKIREQQLYAAQEKLCRAELPRWTQKKRVGLSRGFLNHLEANAREYLRNGSALAKKTLIDSIFFCDHFDEPTLAGLAESPLFPRLRTLGTNSIRSTELERFLPALPGLRSLVLYYPCRFEAAAGERFRAILRLPTFATLRSLTVSVDYMEASAASGIVAALAEATLPALTELSLIARAMSVEELGDILARPFVANLRKLALTFPTEAGHMVRLRETKALAGLRELTVAIPEGSGRKALLTAPVLSNLRSLTLTNVDDALLPVLADSPLLSGLRTLRLWPPQYVNRTLSVDPLRRLFDSGQLRDLVHFSFGRFFPNAGLVEAVAGTSELPGLRYLGLGNAGDDPAFALLAQSPHLPELRVVTGPENLTVPRGVRWVYLHEQIPF